MAFERIRKKMFPKKTTSTDKINSLRERVVILVAERDKVFVDVDEFEQREGSLLQQGKDSKSMVIKRRLAAQLNQVRKDLGRRNSSAAMFNRQIDILNTDIHNLTLIRQGAMASVGDIQEITDNAVKAEEMMENLDADAEVASNILSISDDMSEEELAILKEFEGEEEQPESESEPAAEEITEAQREKQSQLADLEQRLGSASRA